MARFQALTNRVLDAELDMIRVQLGLAPSQKAELLREVAALAAWVVRQAGLGRVVAARRGKEVESLAHPAVERLQRKGRSVVGDRLAFDDHEVRQLAKVLDRGFTPSRGLQKALANLASSSRRAPTVRWKKSPA